MNRFTLVPAVALVVAFQSLAAGKAEFGTAAEAKALLDKTVAAMKKDKAGTIALINKGDPGYIDRDLYPFCATKEGITVAHPTHVGDNLKERKDKQGKAFGAEMLKVAEEGKDKQVSYMWPKPGGKDPVQKVTYVTKVADHICGVGYYK